MLGSQLVARLLERQQEVRVATRPGTSLALLEKVLKKAGLSLQHPGLSFMEVDLQDITEVEAFVAGASHVFHCAAKVSFHPSDRKTLVAENRSMTATLVNALFDHPLKPYLMHVSSIAALGREEAGKEISEASTWKEGPANSVYAQSKYAAELEVWRGFEEGLAGAMVNPGVIVGEGRWSDGSARMIKQVHDGLRFYTHGVNGFVDVNDVVQAMLLLVDKGIHHERYVLVGENASYKHFFDTIALHLGVKAPSMEAKPWMGQVVWRVEWLRNKLFGSTPMVTRETARSAQGRYVYNSGKIQQLGLQFTPLDETLQRVCRAYLEDQSSS